MQKCVRAGGKHNDLDDIGRTNRHFSFFEMLGNFSFGDYFKADAIPWAWELVTDGARPRPRPALGHRPRRPTTRPSAIWRDTVGLPPERIQRLGDDNFWRMADTGPCGPSSEIFWDLGPEFGADGGPADGARTASSRSGTSCSCSSTQQPDGTLVAAAQARASTPAPGSSACSASLQGVDSIWDIDVFRPLIAAAEPCTGVRYGGFPGADATCRCGSSPSTAAR